MALIPRSECGRNISDRAACPHCGTPLIGRQPHQLAGGEEKEPLSQRSGSRVPGRLALIAVAGISVWSLLAVCHRQSSSEAAPPGACAPHGRHVLHGSAVHGHQQDSFDWSCKLEINSWGRARRLRAKSGADSGGLHLHAKHFARSEGQRFNPITMSRTLS
jgi:hypothetical protein